MSRCIPVKNMAAVPKNLEPGDTVFLFDTKRNYVVAGDGVLLDLKDLLTGNIPHVRVPGPTGVGEKGEKGDQGLPGKNGNPGERGLKGERGEPGQRGDKGDKGDKGESGQTGGKGDRGERGERGLRGEKGEQGFRGESGKQGERGLKGERGDRGLQGERGSILVVDDKVLQEAVKQIQSKRVALLAQIQAIMNESNNYPSGAKHLVQRAMKRIKEVA